LRPSHTSIVSADPGRHSGGEPSRDGRSEGDEREIDGNAELTNDATERPLVLVSTFPGVPVKDGKCLELSTVFALKHAHLLPITGKFGSYTTLVRS
jgi:hypothetical protein